MQILDLIDCLPPTYARLYIMASRNPRCAVQLAHRAYDRASAQDQDDTEHTMRGWAAYTLGVSYLAWERIGSALPWLIEALERFQQEGLPLAILIARAALLKQQYLAGTAEDLQGLLAALASDADMMGQPLLAAQIRLVQIAHLNVLGRSEDSLALCTVNKDIITTYGTPNDQAQLLRLSAMAACDHGNLDDAAVTLELALQGFQRIHEHAGVARCLFDRAWINQRREHYEAALLDLDAAQAIAERLDLIFRIAFCEKNRGAALTDLGRYDQAFAASLRAWAMFLDTGRHDYAASCDLNMGNIAYYSGLFILAAAAYQRAHQVYRQYHMVRMEAVSQRNQALALRAQGDPVSACRMLGQLLDDPRYPKDALERAEVHFELARCFVDLRQDDKAVAQWSHAEALFATHGNQPAIAQCQLEQAWLLLAQGHIEPAQTALLASQSQLIEQPMHHWRVMYGLGRCAELQDDKPLARLHYDQAITTVTALRQRLASEHASGGIFAQAQQLFRDSLRLAVQCGDTWATLRIIEQQRALTFSRQLQQTRHAPPIVWQDTLAKAQLQLVAAPPSLRDEALRTYQEVLLRVRHSDSSMAMGNQYYDFSAADLATLRAGFIQAFDNNWTVLTYAEFDTGLLIVVLDAETLTVEHCTLTVALQRAIERACQPQFRLFTYLDLPYHDGSSAKPWADLTLLGTQLIPALVRAQLHTDRRLIIVPAGPLHVLPWSALRVNDAWLCEQSIPQLLPSLHTWQILHHRQSTEGNAALLVGIAEFRGRAPDLPNAIAALDLVERHWPTPVVRIEATAATRGALKTLSVQGALRRYRHMFFATHGQLVAASGLLAHLKLVDEDILYDDITQLQLEGALVVLAACDGALGEVLPGEEVLSLSRAFLSCGACDVIASLWPLYDSTILDLLELLYVALASGCDAPSAVVYAQRNLLRMNRVEDTEDSLVASPFVWGGMSAYGAGTARSGHTPNT